MGWCERSWRWAALVSSLVIAGVFAVVPSASSSADAPRGLVRAPGGPYAIGGNAVAFSPHGRWLATAGEGLSVLRVNQRTGRLRRVAHVPSPGLEHHRPSRSARMDGSLQRRVLRLRGETHPAVDFRVNRYNGTLRKVAGMSRKRDDRITDVAFDPTGRFLAIPGECGVQIITFNRRPVLCGNCRIRATHPDERRVIPTCASTLLAIFLSLPAGLAIRPPCCMW